MAECKECIHNKVCFKQTIRKDLTPKGFELTCDNFKSKDCVEVVRCKDCKFSRPLDKSKSPEKYFKNSCVVCECETVVGDEPIIYINTHFCSYGERKDS
jgi:hypothetical protein